MTSTQYTELGGVRPDGLAILSPPELALRAEIEAAVVDQFAEFAAIEIELPRLITIDDAASIDYFQNFPQLGLAVSALAEPDAVAARARAGDPTIGVSDLAAPQYVLPSAGCYGLYFALRGRTVPDLARYTLCGHCFRREAHFSRLDRLLGFTMREYVMVGTREAVEEFVRRGHALLPAMAEQFGVTATLTPASDPFFEQNGARATMQRLFPVKHELVSAHGVALASVNFHRNFFGERCDIRLAGGELAYTACIGLGVERWISELGRTRSAG